MFGPALPLGEAGKYVAAAYLVFFALVIVYVGIMGARVVRMERELTELDELVSEADEAPAHEHEHVVAATVGQSTATRERP
jgi:Na+-transporting methylmalonyl-CoA/oxaloacetate decarboxylase gamma subunit